ncbi:MAG: hypothetical protein ABIP48_20440, partial [Planctomycetota bacterium]
IRARSAENVMHHAIWTDLHELYQQFQQRISALERELAGDLVQTPYVRLLAITGLNVVSAAELAGEMGPITRYANANAITGRCGPSPGPSSSTGPDPLARRARREFHKPGDGPCNWCHRFDWWRSMHGVIVCGRCHPPAVPGLAVEWLKPSEN